jgi:hypothetical protein
MGKRQCLFCHRLANSREHIIADWILKEITVRGPSRLRIGKYVDKLVDLEQKVRAVCSICNEGWMSKLEQEVKPTIGPLLNDISFKIDFHDQSVLALWALKTAMVIESTNTRYRKPCYSRPEREQLRVSSTLPAKTAVWLGRYFTQGLGTLGTDIGLNLPDIPKVANACVTTIVIGHLSIQILTVHIRPEYSYRTINVVPQLSLNDFLIPIWPPERQINWPPSSSFTNSGSSSIGLLVARWQGGTEIPDDFPI